METDEEFEVVFDSISSDASMLRYRLYCFHRFTIYICCYRVNLVKMLVFCLLITSSGFRGVFGKASPVKSPDLRLLIQLC